MKALVNREPLRDRPWGGGNLFLIALCDSLLKNNIEVTHRLDEDIDIIFMQDPRYSDLQISVNEIASYKTFKPDTKIIHRVNECDARKNTDDMDNLLRECSRITDHTVFVSDWMREYHIARGWNCLRTSVIHNGVDLNHFSPRDKIDNGKINIVTHHWSNNRMKGFDIYEKLDRFVKDSELFTFTYIGRHNNTFKNTKTIDPLCGIDLGKELSKYSVYISGSVYDPGPNHILESIACKIPTYVISTGGGAVEFAGQDHTYDTFEELIEILKSRVYKANDYNARSWSECIDDYMSIIEQCRGK